MHRPKCKTLYILDEPTTGLHTADIEQLLQVLNRLVEAADTVVVIEHNLDVIKTADYIIELGPEGSERGGQVVATGTPEAVARVPHSYTGQFLARVLGMGHQPSAPPDPHGRAAPHRVPHDMMEVRGDATLDAVARGAGRHAGAARSAALRG